MSYSASPGFTCPECGRHSTHPADAEFGYCGVCHAYTGAVARTHELGDALPQYRVNRGGLMRCCTGALRAWLVLHPGPWPTGTTIECPHHGSWTATIRFDGECWAWHNPEDDDADS